MRCRIVRPTELSDRDVGAWRELACRAAEPNVFFEPEFLVPAARHLAPGAVRLVVAEDSGGWAACVAVHRAPRTGRLPIPCLTAWTHDYSGLEVPLVDADRALPAVETLLSRLRRALPGVLVAFPQVPDDGPFRAALGELMGGALVQPHRFRRAALRRRPAFTYLDGMRPKRRAELARKRRRLEERHRVDVRDRAGDPEAVEAFLRLEAAGWKGSGGTALASRSAHAAFFREMCAALGRAGRLELLALEVDGAPIAMKCNLIAGTRVFGFKQAYDEAWSSHSPGRLLDVDTMERFHARSGVDLLDTIASPRADAVNAAWPDRIPMGSLLVPARGPAGWAAARAVAAAVRARGRAPVARDAPVPEGVRPQAV